MADKPYRAFVGTRMYVSDLEKNEDDKIPQTLFVLDPLIKGRSVISVLTVSAGTQVRRKSFFEHYVETSCCLFKTRHRASTSMHSLTFCIRIMLPERHQWKPAVQAAAVMLRTPPVDRQSPASSTRIPRRAFALCRHIAGWTQACNCHSNATHAPIANPPNSAQLGASPTTTSSYIRVRAVVWACGRGQTDTQMRVTTIHFVSSTTHAKCNELFVFVYVQHTFMVVHPAVFSPYLVKASLPSVWTT